KRLARVLGLVSAAALLLASAPAVAQVDVSPPLDNVMLLVDTSGSMEFQFDGSAVTCSPGNTAGTNHRSRWVHLLEALTGTISNYSCEQLDRDDPKFAGPNGEYSIDDNDAYDYKHPIPYHRPMSGGCSPRPGNLPSSGNLFAYPAGAIAYKNIGESSCTFQQSQDGMLDSFASEVRFGLMTFDSLTHAGTGIAGTTGANYADGLLGTWSYFPRYLDTTGTPAEGAVAECAVTDQEVGARNGAAPPWEGRMVNFGDPADGGSGHLLKAQQIQEILLATRPFGATPIAGMLRDAETFFFEDDYPDYTAGTTTSLKFGPKDDPYVDAGCREQFVVLITDGHPNLDLRDDCVGDTSCASGDEDCKCPYDPAETIALRLASSATRPSVPVFVIGVALDAFTYPSSGTATVTCNGLNDTDFATACDSSAAADLANRGLQACCSLRDIAAAGKDPNDSSSTAGKAFFVDTPEALRSALSAVLSRGLSDSSRTQPVFSGAGGNVASSQRYYSSYIPKEFKPWEGRIERERYVCEDDDANPATPKQPVPVDVDPTAGDDFAANLNSGNGAARRFYTVIGGTGTETTIDSGGTIRPYISDTPADGLSAYRGYLVTGTDDTSTAFTAQVPAKALDLPNTSCTLADNACRDRYLNWLIGLPNGTTNSRCDTRGSADCALLGDVFHSTPRVVNRPVAALRDETYTKFASSYATRPAVLYTSTNDGFLHAFKTFSNLGGDPDDLEENVLTKTNNELWAFIPPAVLPDLDGSYPYTHQLLLDGAPVVKDVVAIVDENDDTKIYYQRSQTTAQAGSNGWRTVLVQGFGRTRGGYFAVDITQPVPGDNPLEVTADGGPRFLWQLTKDADGKDLFGSGGATPLITTLFINKTEVAVAVLPGGVGKVEGSAACPAGLPSDIAIEEAFGPRDEVRCYKSETVGAHSLTIVRLDTGEILRTFRRTDTEMAPEIKTANVIGIAPLASPITGQPVAYPAEVGAVADRIFVGDADGRIWKVDVSGDSPAGWTMNLFFDTYPADAGAVQHDFDDGQPIQTPPVLSVDDLGLLTVGVSTGDQDTTGTDTTMTNYVWSLTENIVDNVFETKVNWYQPLEDGERVTGPMSLFSSALYFSTFSPRSTNDSVCSSGSSRLWGVDYLTPAEETNLAAGGAAVALKQAPTDTTFVQYLEFENLVAGGPDGVKPVVFGVTIAQLPTCFEDIPAADGDWLGFGSHSAMNQINPGKFELVVHTGQAGESIPGGTTNVFKMDLPTPPALTSIDSWAAIVE
ncbi:MAG TPA: hypothetical protein VM686_23270, partial [Polyangiaceae bacterium]|nr:hypothetical protein [Polyangiaceae bacterium]